MSYQIIILSLVISLTIGCTSNTNESDSRYVSSKELLQIIDQGTTNKDVILIDLRTPEEISKTGIIPQATVINFFSKDFDSSLKRLNKEKTYIVYCKAGGRSTRAAKKMKQFGLTVKNFSGGMDGWLSKNNKTIPLTAK